MSSIDNLTEAFESVRKSHEAGRLAHAYIIVGSPRGDALTFAESVLKLINCAGSTKPCGTCPDCLRVTARTHPDVMWIEPESKSRQIVIDKIHELTQQMAQTSYAGGWKAAVLVHADRVNPTAWNALLKTLEEPTPRTLFLLLTDSPQSLLTTVVSRCHRISLSAAEVSVDGDWRRPLMETLRASGGGAMERLGLAGRIKVVLEEEKKKITAAAAALLKEEDDLDSEVVKARIQAAVLRVRSDIVLNILLWKRDLMLCAAGADPELLHFQGERETLTRLATGLTIAKAAAGVEAAQAMIRRLERNVPDLAAMEGCFLS